MSAAAATQWHVLPRSLQETPPPLPAGAPIVARLVHAAYYALDAGTRADIRAGRNSRRVSLAFDQLDVRTIVPLRLTRRERGKGIEYLTKHNAFAGGAL